MFRTMIISSTKFIFSSIGNDFGGIHDQSSIQGTGLQIFNTDDREIIYVKVNGKRLFWIPMPYRLLSLKSAVFKLFYVCLI